MKKLIILGMLSTVLGMLSAQPVQPETKSYVLERLHIQGARSAHPEQIRNLSGLREGQSITVGGYLFSSALKRIYAAGFFDDVQLITDSLVNNKAYITLRVEERPRISNLSLTGISKRQHKELKEEIAFVQGSMFSPSKVKEAQRKIHNYLQEKGYYQSTVSVHKNPDPILKSGVELKYHIEKGPRNKISKIVVQGNESIPQKRFRKAFKPIPQKSSLRFWKKSKISTSALDEAKSNLLSYYRDQGFRDARLVKTMVEVMPNSDVEVLLEVDEGSQFYHGNLKFIGNHAYSDSVLHLALGIQKGDIFSQTSLNERLYGGLNYPGLSSLYLDNGYLFFNIEAVETGLKGDTVDLELRIREGSPTVISKVTLRGNTKTYDEVILRRLRTQPGNIFRRADLMRSQRELINMNYFDPATLNVIPKPDPETGTVELEYELTEKPSDRMQLSGGWSPRSTDDNGNVIGGGLVGTLQFSLNNFSTRNLFNKRSWAPIPSGGGQQLNIALQSTGRRSNNLSVNFLEPWLGGKKPTSLGFGFNLYNFENQVNNDEGGIDLFRTSSFSTSLDFGTFLNFPDDYTQSLTSLSYRYNSLLNPGIYYQEFEGEERAYINTLTLRQTFTRNSLDHPIFPSTGSFNQLSGEFTPPYSLFGDNTSPQEQGAAESFKFLEYYKILLKSQWYTNPVGKLVLQARLDAGYLGAYNADLGVSPFERFVLGGAGIAGVGNNGIRGIDPIPLRGYKLQVFDNDGAYYTFFNRLSFEVRHPINLTPEMPLWVLGFAEAGNASEGIRSYKFSDIKRSAGLGFRIQLPMVGLMGLDWGYGFDKDPAGNLSGNQFHFIFGREF